MLLHEWVELFANTYDLDREGDGFRALNYFIKDSKEGIYADKYKDILCLSLPEFINHLKDDETELTDFIYDRKTGYVLCNFRYNSRISHEMFADGIASAIDTKNYKWGEGADLYVNNYGFLMSSASYFQRLTIGEDFRMNAQEKQIFGKWNKDYV